MRRGVVSEGSKHRSTQNWLNSAELARHNSPRTERAALSANAVPPRGQLEVVDESDMHERLLQTVTPGNAPPPIQEELLQGWKAVRVHMRAWANLYGAQFVWLGVWSAMTVDVERNWGWVPGVKRDLLYVGFGLACSLLFDQFYADAGVAGSMWLDLRNDKWFGCMGCCGATRQAPLVSKLAFVIATPLTLFSNIVLWIGLCSLLDDWVFAELVALGGGCCPGMLFVYVASVLLAPLIMWLTDTLYIDSGIDDATDDSSVVPSWGSGWRVHARAVGRGALALLGQILLFYGGYALCALYCINPTCSDPAENLWKVLFEIALGMYLWTATDSFLVGAEMTAGAEAGLMAADDSLSEDDSLDGAESDTAPQPSSKGRLGMALRSVLCNYAGIVHNIGIWQLLDGVLVPGWSTCSSSPSGATSAAEAATAGVSSNHLSCPVRNGLYVGIGVLLSVDVFLLPLLAKLSDADFEDAVLVDGTGTPAGGLGNASSAGDAGLPLSAMQYEVLCDKLAAKYRATPPGLPPSTGEEVEAAAVQPMVTLLHLERAVASMWH